MVAHSKMVKNSILHLANLGMLCVEGPNAKQFLQGQLTCNLDDLSPTQTRLGAQCNPQGRIIHFFRLFYYREHYYLQMPAAIIPAALAALKKYAIFFKVTLSDASHLFNIIGYYGNQLQNYFPNIPEKIDEFIESNELLILNLSGRYQILGQAAPIALLWEKLMTDNQHVSSESWKALDFEKNIPTIYPETSEKFLPHDIQLPALNAVSFNKGCYTGQEIIARMHYRAKIKNQLWQMTVTTELTPQRGADIYDQTNIAGILVDYYKTSYNTYVLQIMAAHTDGLYLDPDKQYPLIR